VSGDDVYEVKLDDEFLRSGLFIAGESALRNSHWPGARREPGLPTAATPPRRHWTTAGCVR
jgi:hypothetical protein